MAKKKAAELPVWNLNELYRGIKDPRIAKDLQHAVKEAEAFAKRYRGRLTRHAVSAERLKRVLEEYERLLQRAALPSSYAHLLFAESSSDERRGGLVQQADAGYAEFLNHLVFFDLELLTLPVAQLRKLSRAKALYPYNNYLQRLLAGKPHRLAEREEQLLNQKQLTSSAAFSRLFDEELSAKRLKVKGLKGARGMSLDRVLTLLHDHRRPVRKAAAESISAGLHGDLRRMAFIYSAIIQDWDIDRRERSFAEVEDPRHLSNQIDGASVETMTEVIAANFKIVSRYYRVKAKALKLKELYDYDRYAPVGKDRRYPFSWAQEQVLSAFSRFSEEYAALAREFFDKRWIDAAPRPGKRGGAFCSYLTPDRHPYVCLSYHGTLRDVFTLAHELGHGVHALLMRPQGYLAFDVPLTMAETASVFSEMLLFDHLRETLDTPDARFSLYAGTLENIFATVFRQAAMYRFEQDAHRERAHHGGLTTAGLNALWRKHSEAVYGPAIKITPGHDSWWSYIPHFVHTPFYVYAYAFGELLSLALYARFRQSGEKFVQEYLGVLSAGATRSPQDLLKPLGINLADRRFWEGGVKIISNMVDDLSSVSGRSKA